MRTFRLIGMALLALSLCSSCNLIKKQRNKREREEKEKIFKSYLQHDYSIQEPKQEPKRTVDITFNVRARIYRVFSGDYEKETDVYADLEITLYKEGEAYCTRIGSNKKFLRIRHSFKDGYDFECDDIDIRYKFKTNKML